MMRRQLILFIFFIPFYLFGQKSTDTLLVAYTPASPFIIQENENIGGVSVWLWEKCAKELNLPYKIVQMPFKNVLDALEKEEIDISINPLTITSDRMNSMHFTHAFYASHSIAVKGHLSRFQRVLNFFKSFFSLNFLSAFLGLMTLVILFSFLVWHFEHKVNPQNFRKGWQGLWDGLWWSVVTMTTVGYGDKTPKSRGGKIVALVWMFSGLLFISGLTASVASSLTVDQLHSEMVKLEDLKNRAVGTIKHSSSEQYLRDNFFKNIQTYENVPAGLDDLVAHELDAFVYDEPIVRYRIKNDDKYQDLEILTSRFKVQFYAFALAKKHEVLRNTLSQKIVELIERNEWQRVLHEYDCTEE